MAGRAEEGSTSAALSLPDRASFLTGKLCYLDSGSQHPLSKGGRQAVDGYLAHRMLDPDAPATQFDEDKVRAKFARLINADPDEVAFVTSTTAGEQMVLRGLNLPASRAHIISDELHFFGSLPLYEEMARQGASVSWIKAVDGRIRLDDIRRALRKDTRLIALSLVSTINGFEHDLKAVCDLAHANGTLVYADIVHAAGCVPVDVKASGVDFAACASYKWLMGEFGLGFIYASKAAQAQLKRTEYGYYGMSAFDSHIYPFDKPGARVVDYAYADNATGHFAHGTMAHPVMAQLDYSLDYIDKLGVARIQAHARTLTAQLKEELPRLGYTVITPPESGAPIVTCALQDARTKLAARLKAAGIRITVSQNRFRVTPSVFNTHADIEYLLSTLGRAAARPNPPRSPDHMPSFPRALRTTALLLALATCYPPLHAGEAPAEGVRHTLQLPGGAISYRAIWSELVLKDSAGAEQATISTISYLREGVTAPEQRPVIFAFNGGPGASSSMLHTGLLGPQLSAKGVFRDNPDTLLDAADVVLIDPVGTGFNREIKPGGAKSFWTVEADAKAAEAAIRDWLNVHQRTASPIYIIGESYGGYRLATMSSSLKDLNVGGLIMISPLLDISATAGLGNDLPFIFELPTMAATAFAHGKIKTKGRTVHQVFEEARAFAQSDYASALQQGSELSATERDRIARRMAALIGLTPEVVAGFNLRVPSQEFLEQLVPGKIVGRIDTRVTAPKPEKALVEGRSKAADDPALGMGKSNVIKNAPLRDYLKQATGWQGDQDYIGLTLELNFAWDWRAPTAKYEDNAARQATPSLAEFMKAKPQAKLMLINGYYDLATPVLEQRYSLLHSGIERSRMELVTFDSAHAVYDDANRATAAATLRRFITR
ncbi:aminotransferase class V-fold PLP-dependent enzyme [Duganella guangzhouensis]|uniref:aminotransferase class V-fold PLP-dependent enzyme n=1 Tax=Duganella guangzhouensis TaxID=2666084 RepID=UPI001E2A6ACE|nr:aminotransferase class V-fold PLP-dependent enzyme [Duganella guangzhouensis]